MNEWSYTSVPPVCLHEVCWDSINFQILRASGGFYLHNVHTKFCKDLPNDSEVDKGKHTTWRSRHQLTSVKKKESELNLLNTTPSNITNSCRANLIKYCICPKVQSFCRNNIHADEDTGLLGCDTMWIGNFRRL
jgi:hypothetical protein